MVQAAQKLKPAERLTLRAFEQSLPMELLRAREAAMSRFRPILRKHDLTEQQWRVIRVLADHPRTGASELAELSLLLSPSLTRILRLLEEKNLVKRGDDAKDLRRSVFQLTQKGQRLFERVAPDAHQRYQDIETQFGKERLRLLYNLLAEFSSSLTD